LEWLLFIHSRLSPPAWSTAHLMTRDQARALVRGVAKGSQNAGRFFDGTAASGGAIAANIAKLPELLRKT
jgi:hypothetical protein